MPISAFPAQKREIWEELATHIVVERLVESVEWLPADWEVVRKKSHRTGGR